MQWFLVALISSFRRMLRNTLEISQERFLPNPYPPIHYHPHLIRRYTTSKVERASLSNIMNQLITIQSLVMIQTTASANNKCTHSVHLLHSVYLILTPRSFVEEGSWSRKKCIPLRKQSRQTFRLTSYTTRPDQKISRLNLWKLWEVEAPSACTHLLQCSYHYWKNLQNSFLGISNSCSTASSAVVFTS
jgi:hypothetical protein